MGRNIVLFAIIFTVFLTGCYKQDFLQQQNETLKAIDIIEEQEEEIAQLESQIKKNDATIEELTQTVINSGNNCEPVGTNAECDYLQFENELLRYSTTIKKLNYELGLYNNSNYISDLRKNYTNMKYAFLECNDSLTIIKGAI